MTGVQITGKSQLIAHIGVPTEAFKAPMIYNPWFAHCGSPTVVVPMGCEPEDFASFLPLAFRLRNLIGALITMPHKRAVVSLLDEASAAVAICGACNAIRREPDGRLIGDMFDGEGFVRGLRGKGRKIEGSSALVVGAGGVGSAIAASLAASGVARLSLFDQQQTVSQALAARIARAYPNIALGTDDNRPIGYDIVVNATPMGMHPDDPLPFDPDLLDPGSLVGEVVMRQEETPLLAAAKARGCQTQIGTDMLFEQIPAYLEFFGLPVGTPDQLRALAQIEY